MRTLVLIESLRRRREEPLAPDMEAARCVRSPSLPETCPELHLDGFNERRRKQDKYSPAKAAFLLRTYLPVADFAWPDPHNFAHPFLSRAERRVNEEPTYMLSRLVMWNVQMDQSVGRVTQRWMVIVLIAREESHITNAVKERNDVV